MVTIEASASREALKYQDYKIETKCIQQSDIADNDKYVFLQPMADYIAQLIIDDLE